jgi:hypothetical protein
MKLFWFKDKGHSEFLFKEVTLYSYVNIVENKGFWMQEDKKRSNNLSRYLFSKVETKNGPHSLFRELKKRKCSNSRFCFGHGCLHQLPH